MTKVNLDQLLLLGYVRQSPDLVGITPTFLRALPGIKMHVFLGNQKATFQADMRHENGDEITLSRNFDNIETCEENAFRMLCLVNPDAHYQLSR